MLPVPSGHPQKPIPAVLWGPSLLLFTATHQGAEVELGAGSARKWWGLCGAGSIQFTMMCLPQASMRSHSPMQGKVGADAPTCSLSASALAGKAFKPRRNHVGCSLLSTLPQKAFPYVSLYCQNSVEEPWCDRSWSCSWELSENSLVSFDCFGLLKPRNPNQTLEVMQ